MQKIFIPCLLTLSFSLLVPSGLTRAADASFTVSSASTSTQSLGGGQTGTVNSGGSITDSNDEVVITVDNKSPKNSSAITINNSGTIDNTYSTDEDQSSRDIRITGAGTTLVINNAATGIIETSNADVIQEGKNITDSNVTINNRGIINSENTNSSQSANFGNGQQAVDFSNDVSGSTTINNYTGATMEAFDSDVIQSAANGVINNDGTIKSTEPAGDTEGNDGIDAQTNTGVVIVNAAAIGGETVGAALIEGARHGITGGNTTGTGAFTMSITNNVGGTIKGDDGSGINIDGINGNEVVTVVNHGTITGNGVSGDGDGVDVDGLVNLTNTGTIKSLNAKGEASEGVTVGGGTIVNSGLIEGDLSAGNTTAGSSGVGITLAGVDKNANGNPIPPQGIYGNTTVDNSGTIRGQSGAAIQATGAANSFTIGITNEAGGIIEGGGSGAAIQLGGNNDTVINKGTIEADTSGQAVDLGGGTNSFQIVGGSATVTGDISGGTGSTNSSMTVDAGAGDSFSYSGTISNFDTVEAKSGTFNLSGSITGATTKVDSGSTLHLANSTTGAVNLLGTLSGNGTVGALNIGAGSTLSPGNSPGRISAGNTILNPTGNFLLQVDSDGSTGAAGTNWDQLAVTGTVDLTGLSSSDTFVFELQSLTGSDATGTLASFDPNTDHIWADVITTTAGFVGDFNPADFSVDTSLFGNATDGTFSIVRDELNGNDLDLEYTAAPEPKTWALLLGGAALLLGFTRFRHRIA